MCLHSVTLELPAPHVHAFARCFSWNIPREPYLSSVHRERPQKWKRERAARTGDFPWWQLGKCGFGRKAIWSKSSFESLSCQPFSKLLPESTIYWLIWGPWKCSSVLGIRIYSRIADKFRVFHNDTIDSFFCLPNWSDGRAPLVWRVSSCLAWSGLAIYTHQMHKY